MDPFFVGVAEHFVGEFSGAVGTEEGGPFRIGGEFLEDFWRDLGDSWDFGFVLIF